MLLPAVGAVPVGAQGTPRPWLEWRSAQTEHFVIHYPAEYQEWALSLAERVEAIRDAVGRTIGYLPAGRVHVVVDDPAAEANGYAFTPLDAPTIVLWPTPPDPRSFIGNFAVWEELLMTHEFAHIAHLSRPSRNRLRSRLWGLSPVPLGPVASKAPRWVLEGYATYVEGKVTRSGRPNHAWRAAILRQLAIEGRLPVYAQLSERGGWITGDFAYLVGSAYLEWLSERHGDSSVTALWRRMSARTDRSFSAAFSGVYGQSPSEAYGRFAAELTAGAVTLERALRDRGLREGELVQRLQRTTGDPAISPDGRFIALTVRRTDGPSRLVVWKVTETPGDSLAAIRRGRQQRRDPEDVPDRQFHPPPKTIVASLLADDGAPYEAPRWMPDNKHLLVSRSVALADGTVRPDLFLWSAEDGDLRRVTRGAALRDADPSADGRWAAAIRCDRGWCDLVRVDLGTGAIRLLRPGSVTRNFYRPRVSRVTGEIVVAEHSGDRWRIARVSSDSGILAYADPDDGATRYDATYAVDGRTIITTSERGGVANLERLAPGGERATRLTSVTGAAVAADVGPDDSIWFLSLHAAGFDLRRARADSTPIASLDSAVQRAATLARLLPPSPSGLAGDPRTRPAPGAVLGPRPYGSGPSRYRYFPLLSTGFGGTSGSLALVRSDPVGRLGLALVAVAGTAALPQGVRLSAISHRRKTALGVEAWTSHEAPSRVFDQAMALGLDLARRGGSLHLTRSYAGDADYFGYGLSLLAEGQRPSTLSPATRTAAIVAVTRTLRQRDDDSRYQERLSLLGEVGNTAGGSYTRYRGSFELGVGRNTQPLATVLASYGRIIARGGSAREDFVIGGFASPLVAPELDARRVDAPAYPLGTVAGPSFSALRIGLPLPPVDLFYSAVSTDQFTRPRRSFGAEVRAEVRAIAALGTPEVSVLTGLARAVDEPVKRLLQFYLRMSLRP